VQRKPAARGRTVRMIDGPPDWSVRASLSIPRRPGSTQRAAGQNVEVQVLHGLPALPSGVRDDSEAARGVARILRDLRCHLHQVPDECSVVGVGERGDVAPRNHQYVEGRLWLEVLERHGLLVLGDHRCRGLAPSDLAEDAVIRHRRSSLMYVRLWCATSSPDPSNVRASPKAMRLPARRTTASQTRSPRAPRRKLVDMWMVSASGSSPTTVMSAIQKATSATPIAQAPSGVPPGRTTSSLTRSPKRGLPRPGQ